MALNMSQEVVYRCGLQLYPESVNAMSIHAGFSGRALSTEELLD